MYFGLVARSGIPESNFPSPMIFLRRRGRFNLPRSFTPSRTTSDGVRPRWRTSESRVFCVSGSSRAWTVVLTSLAYYNSRVVLRADLNRLDPSIPEESEPPAAPDDRAAERSAEPDGETEQVAEGNQRPLAADGAVAQDARGGDPGGHAERQRQSAGPPLAGSEGGERPHRGVRHDIAVVPGGAPGADGAGPAKLVAPNVRPSGRAERGFDHGVRELDAAAELVDAPAEMEIIREAIRERIESADLREIRGAQGHRGAEGESLHAEQARGQYAGGEFGGDAESLEAGRPPVRGGTVKAGDEADGSIGERCRGRAQVAGLDQNVAIVNEQDRVARAPGEIGEYAHFGVGRGGRDVVERDGEVREFGLQTRDIGRGGVVWIAEAEQHLESGVVLDGVGADGVVEPGVAAADRFEDGDRRQAAVFGRPSAGHAPAPPEGGEQGEQVIGGGEKRGNSQPAHSETSATPQMTRTAPAQRSQVTRSRRI